MESRAGLLALHCLPAWAIGTTGSTSGDTLQLRAPRSWQAERVLPEQAVGFLQSPQCCKLLT